MVDSFKVCTCSSESLVCKQLHCIPEASSYLPSIVVSYILSHLSWTDKLNAVRAIPAWKEHLYTMDAWPLVDYCEHNIGFLTERLKLLDCIVNYGRYLKKMKMNFHPALDDSVVELLKAMTDHCCNLTHLHLWNGAWMLQSTQQFISFLDKCQSLCSLSIVKPDLKWNSLTKTCKKDNILALLSLHGHAHKVRDLLLDEESLLLPEPGVRHSPISQLLQKYTSLKRLKIRRNELSESSLIHLASTSLEELTTYQTEELLFGESMAYQKQNWLEVCTHKPNFRFNLLLKDVVVLRTSFPQCAPLRVLVLIDLATSLTMGILETINECYAGTLEVFVYAAKDSVSCEVEDKRLPSALVHLAKKCKHLNTLVYGFDISASTVLSIAQTTKLSCLGVDESNLLFDQDWHVQSVLSPMYVQWLQCAGSSLYNLEVEVSAIYGYTWTASSPQHMRHLINQCWDTPCQCCKQISRLW